ncbi:mitochondrial carrier triple repeat protein 1-like [Sarcoptes scabiei]|nr:mitochondrial carrier triple repeat protein 1-like [Sarcoptes scabiei]
MAPVSEDPMDFIKFLCVFASVMTTVLVLMFYMVGEAAFRLILLVITFVSILTFCLACILRRPSLVVMGQTLNPYSHHLSYIKPQPSTINGWAIENQRKHGKDYMMDQTSRPYLLIVPTLLGQSNSAIFDLKQNSNRMSVK